MKTVFLTLCFCLAIGHAFAQAAAKGATIAGTADQGMPGKTWAVVVGISKYKNIQSLNYADRDAQVFYDYLVNTDGGPKLEASHVKLLLNENARSTEIYGALDWLSGSVKENDRVLFYFSGHGDVERKTIVQNGFLLAHDAPNAAYMTCGTISIKYLQDYLETYVIQNKAKDVILIADACRSGKLAGGIEGIQLTMHALGQSWNNQIIKILSAQEGEVSYEDKKWGGGRGVFSYYLMKGVEGEASRRNDSVITTTDLKIYLDRAVADATGNVQNPNIDGNPRQLLFTFNQKLLQLAKIGEEPSGQMLAATGKGAADEISPGIQLLYKKYLGYLKAGRLIKGEGWMDTLNCARHVYWQLINKPGAETIQASLKSSFIAALQRKTQDDLDNFVKGKKTTFSPSEEFREISYLEQLISPGYILYNYIMARAYFMTSLFYDNISTKIALLKKSLRIEEDAPYALSELGSVYDRLGMRDSALYCYQKALLAAPRWSYAYYNIGLVYDELKSYDKALINYQKTIQLDSTDANAYDNIGDVYTDLKSYDKAKIYFQKAVQLDSTNAKPYNNIGTIYYFLKLYEKAIPYYQKAIQLDSTIAEPYKNIGNVYYVLKLYEKAKLYYQKAIQLDNTNPNACYNLGNHYSHLRTYDKAIIYYKKAIQLDSTDAKAYYAIGNVYLDLKFYDEGIIYLQKTIHLDSADAKPYDRIGDVYYFLKLYNKAIIYYKKAIAIDSTSVNDYSKLGYVYILQKDFKNGFLNLQKALNLSPADPWNYYNLACASSLAGETDKGLEYLKQALEKGFKDYEHIQKDEDISNLRKMPEFSGLMKQYFPDKVK